MKKIRNWIPAAVLLLAWTGCADGSGTRTTARPSRETDLDRFVRQVGPHFSYRRVETARHEGFRVHTLNLTSQAWRGADEVDRPVWWHWVTIIEPDRVTGETAFLLIGSGRNDDPAPDRPDPRLTQIALATGTVAVEVRQVPNQPLQFAGDPSGPLREDRLIAFGWEKFLRGGDSGWLPRLPMTRSVVRTMDMVTDFFGGPEGGGRRIDRFVVAGSSKRGWTAWTTAAADRRVVAVVPMVIDLLNMEESFRHHYRSYGFWAEAIDSYVERGIPDWFGSPEMKRLTRIVEPFEYRERLALPKLLLNAAGDQFFLPDSSRFYFDDLPGEKHLRYIPNTGHSLGRTDAAETLLAFYRGILTGRPRPAITWSRDPDGALRARTSGDPSRVLLWQATNPAARDFRIDTIGRAWTSRVLEPVAPGEYLGRVEEPEAGWTAFFIEATFPGPGPEPFKITTEVGVVPDRLPFPDPPGIRNRDGQLFRGTGPEF